MYAWKCQYMLLHSLAEVDVTITSTKAHVLWLSKWNNLLNTIFWTPVTQLISLILDKHFFQSVRKVCWVNLWQKVRRFLAISLSEGQGQAPTCLHLTSVWPSPHNAGSYLMVKTWHVKSCAHKKECLNICVLCCWITAIFNYLKSFILIFGSILADPRPLFYRCL